MTRRLALLATVSSALWLAACGGGGSSSNGTATLRAINLTTDVPNVDIYTGDTKRFGPAATDTVTNYTGLDATTYAFNVKRSTDSATIFTGSYSLGKDLHYTAIVYGRETAMRLATLPEDDGITDLVAGNTRVRMFNATVDAGTFDVYFTSTDADLTKTTPTRASLTIGSLASYNEIAAGTYRLRVTAAGDATDVRLDVPALTLSDRGLATLVLTAGSSGALLNGSLISQQGSVTTMKNTKARVRLAASVDLAGTVSASIGGATVFDAYRSPRVGNYALVDSGTKNLTVTANGTAFYNASSTFVAGADYTLLAYGPAAGVMLKTIVDDNSVPTTTGRAKLRLVNGLAGSEPLSLTLDYQSFSVTSDIAPGVASLYATPATAGTQRIDIISPLFVNPIFTLTSSSATTALLTSQGVYTIFILSGQTTGGVTAPAGRFVKDR